MGLWVKESTTTPEMRSCADKGRVKIRNRKETIALALPHFDESRKAVWALTVGVVFIVNNVINGLVE